MDPNKVKVVRDWPTPENRKQLQCFLGFANFYRHFIKGYSLIASPLHKLTSTKTKFKWSPVSEKPFSLLNDWFSSAPVLILPDPSQQFIVEVDTYDSGVGAVLFQRSANGNKIHRCAFYSR